jgi:hypothetical protein
MTFFKKNWLVFLLVLISFILGFFALIKKPSLFESLSDQEAYQDIITKRDRAIKKAVAAGNYRCCINPPCTMCYMEPNQWNNFTPGTCACDDLIAEGKNPCPQCARGLCGEEGTCQLNQEGKN